MTFKPSEYQIAIFDAIKNTSFGNIMVDAKAGSGKTKTIVESLKFCGGNILMMAFNKDIADELKERVKLPNVNIATFHSVGYRALRKHLGNKFIKVNDNKINGIIRSKFSQDDQVIYSAFVSRLVSLGKNSGIGTHILEDNSENWMNIIEHFNLEPSSEDFSYSRAIELASKTLNASSSSILEIDFDDMLYIPLKLKCAFERYDWVFVDELQDTNHIQRELVKRMIKPNSGRFVGVGDPRQAIYGFRGADAFAMDKIKGDFKCSVLPLSVSYRCSKSVISLAQNIVSDIFANENAAEGSVSTVDAYSISNFGNKDAIICRNVAPLVKFAYNLISRNKGFNFLGRDFGNGLISLIKRIAGVKTEISQFTAKLENWRKREIEKLIEKDQENKVTIIEDQYESISTIINNLSDDNYTVNGLIEEIRNLFNDGNKDALTLCSIHKSKGLEFDKVFALDRCLLPSKFAKKTWMLKQEENLEYVLYTRAKNDLVFINSDCWSE